MLTNPKEKIGVLDGMKIVRPVSGREDDEGR